MSKEDGTPAPVPTGIDRKALSIISSDFKANALVPQPGSPAVGIVKKIVLTGGKIYDKSSSMIKTGKDMMSIVSYDTHYFFYFSNHLLGPCGGKSTVQSQLSVSILYHNT